MEANRRTNHYKKFDWFKFENVLHIVMTFENYSITHKYSKSDLRKWFENYNHNADFGKMDFNTFWSDIRGKECDYILKHFRQPVKRNNGHWFGLAAVIGTILLIMLAIAVKNIVIYY